MTGNVTSTGGHRMVINRFQKDPKVFKYYFNAMTPDGVAIGSQKIVFYYRKMRFLLNQVFWQWIFLTIIL